MMSQRMQHDEEQGSYQTGYAPSSDYEDGPGSHGPKYENHFDVSSGQKLNQRPASHALSPGQRLALAIVSVVILIPLVSMLLGDPDLSFLVLLYRSIAFGVACLTLVIINIVFNSGH